MSYPDSVDTRLLALLDNVAWAKHNCRHCNRPLWLVRVNGGYNVAYTSEGRNHLEDCPQDTQQSPGSQEAPALRAAQDHRQGHCDAST